MTHLKKVTEKMNLFVSAQKEKQPAVLQTVEVWIALEDSKQISVALLGYAAQLEVASAAAETNSRNSAPVLSVNSMIFVEWGRLELLQTSDPIELKAVDINIQKERYNVDS